MPIKAASLYTDKQLIALTTDELWLATVAEAVLQGQQPPLEIFVLEPHGVAYLTLADATKPALANILRVNKKMDGTITADAPTVTVTPRWTDAPDVFAFGQIRDAVLTRFAEAQISVAAGTRLQQKATAILTAVGNNLPIAQAVWAATETKAWPL